QCRGPQMQVGAGMGVGSALVPRSGSGSELSPSAPCSQTPTIMRITTRTATTATTHPPQLTMHQGRIIRPHGAVGALIIVTITLVSSGRTPSRLSPAQVRYLTLTISFGRPQRWQTPPAGRR